MGYKRKFDHGHVPSYGAIFMANRGTKKECFQRKLFGLPIGQSDFVLHVKKGMMLFLFEFEKRQLHGVFRATANGAIDIELNAFRSSGKQFPAQVPFTSFWDCDPLYENEFKDAIKDNYFSLKKFKFGLSKDQVNNLMDLFRSKRIHKNEPPRTCLRYHDDKPSERDTRFDDNRKKVRHHRIREEEEDDYGFDIDEVDDRGRMYRNLLAENNRLHTVIKTELESINRKVDRAIQDAKHSSEEAILEARLEMVAEFENGEHVTWDTAGWDKKLKDLRNERMVEKEFNAEKDAGTQGVAEKGEGSKGGDGGDEMNV